MPQKIKKTLKTYQVTLTKTLTLGTLKIQITQFQQRRTQKNYQKILIHSGKVQTSLKKKLRVIEDRQTGPGINLTDKEKVPRITTAI